MSPTFSSAPELREQVAPGPHHTLLVEARDFLSVHLPKLTDKQRRTILAWLGGGTFREIAAAEQITEEAVHARLQSAFRRLRQLDADGVGERAAGAAKRG